MKNLSAIILFSSLLLLACTKQDYKPNIKTMVFGQAYDNENGEPYRGLKLWVGEYKSHSTLVNGGSKDLISIRDSAVTDSNGNYKMIFTTSGKGNYYYLNFKNVPGNVRYISDQYKFDQLEYNKTKEITNIGASEKYDFYVWRQYYMRSKITFSGNTAPPVTVMAGSIGAPLGGFPCTIYGGSNDTILNIPIPRNTAGFTLLFYITDPTTKNLLRNPLIFLNPVINKDTIQGPAYTVYPATFK